MLCPECQQPMEKVCEECGVFYDVPELIVTDLYNYRARPQRCYKKADHFKEVLYQFQGKEGKDIPLEVVEKVKEKIEDPAKATIGDVRHILRELKLNKYVENAFYILFAASGQDPPYIRREVEDKVVRMFGQIERTFANTKKKEDKRRSFLNYYYVIFKCLELLKETEILPRIPMLKTKLRLRQHDQLWKRICEELDWTFTLTPHNLVNRFPPKNL